MSSIHIAMRLTKDMTAIDGPFRERSHRLKASPANGCAGYPFGAVPVNPGPLWLRQYPVPAGLPLTDSFKDLNSAPASPYGS
ncbi:hypothetical protein [Paenibacillus mesotrionivorans]|uniref:Uncharacterized protein n=1 Tax=Paenibacillus mesotrionivorans TaxID=3160968 RepID=A0ACC7P495_9BACL